MSIELFAKKESLGINVYLKSEHPGYFTPNLVKKIRSFQEGLIKLYLDEPWEEKIYIFWHMQKYPSTTELGLDIPAINKFISKGKPEGVLKYLDDIIDILFLNYIDLGLPIVNCSFVDRPLKDVAQAFFYLNDVTFVLNKHSCASCNTLSPIPMNNLVKPELFPHYFYKKNSYFLLSKFCFEDIKECLSHVEYKKLDKPDADKIKKIFNRKKSTLIKQIVFQE